MNVLKYPDKRLRIKCKKVKGIDGLVIENSKKLLESLKGIDNYLTLINGLAANQIGLSERIVILKRLGNKYVTMINPEIIYSSILFPSIEICASLPHVIRIKKRYFVTEIIYKDLENKNNKIKLYGFTSFTMQQEIDHLNGKLIID